MSVSKGVSERDRGDLGVLVGGPEKGFAIVGAAGHAAAGEHAVAEPRALSDPGPAPDRGADDGGAAADGGVADDGVGGGGVIDAGRAWGESSRSQRSINCGFPDAALMLRER